MYAEEQNVEKSLPVQTHVDAVQVRAQPDQQREKQRPEAPL
jgi:hypothetical protein